MEIVGTTEFAAEVDEVRTQLSPLLVHAMARNDMPQCFEFTRATGVALAQLLYTALEQNQAMAGKLEALGIRMTTRH